MMRSQLPLAIYPDATTASRDMISISRGGMKEGMEKPTTQEEEAG